MSARDAARTLHPVAHARRWDGQGIAPFGASVRDRLGRVLAFAVGSTREHAAQTVLTLRPRATHCTTSRAVMVRHDDIPGGLVWAESGLDIRVIKRSELT